MAGRAAGRAGIAVHRALLQRLHDIPESRRLRERHDAARAVRDHRLVLSRRNQPLFRHRLREAGMAAERGDQQAVVGELSGTVLAILPSSRFQHVAVVAIPPDAYLHDFAGTRWAVPRPAGSPA